MERKTMRITEISIFVIAAGVVVYFVGTHDGHRLLESVMSNDIDDGTDSTPAADGSIDPKMVIRPGLPPRRGPI